MGMFLLEKQGHWMQGCVVGKGIGAVMGDVPHLPHLPHLPAP